MLSIYAPSLCASLLSGTFHNLCSGFLHNLPLPPVARRSMTLPFRVFAMRWTWGRIPVGLGVVSRRVGFLVLRWDLRSTKFCSSTWSTARWTGRSAALLDKVISKKLRCETSGNRGGLTSDLRAAGTFPPLDCFYVCVPPTDWRLSSFGLVWYFLSIVVLLLVSGGTISADVPLCLLARFSISLYRTVVCFPSIRIVWLESSFWP